MREVEIKIKNIDKSRIIRKIEEIGAELSFRGKVVDFRFDTIDKELSRQGKALRIRQKGKYTYLNFKGKKKNEENIVNRDEIGVRVSNLKVMHKILNELGFVKIFELSKLRTEYKLSDVKFDIDEYIGLEPILEIEASSYEKVREYIKKLEIEEKDIGRVYIKEIIAAKKFFDVLKN